MQGLESSRIAELELENARLREANRRLQAEGPALERDKLVGRLRARITELERERDEERERECSACRADVCGDCESGWPAERDKIGDWYHRNPAAPEFTSDCEAYAIRERHHQQQQGGKSDGTPTPNPEA